VIEKPICIKTPEQIEGIKKSCQLAAKTLAHLEQFAKVGISTAAIDAEAEIFMRDHGAIPACLGYRGFPKSICTSLNEVVCHGIPSPQSILKEGDILNIDVTTILDGYYGDTCKMYPIGEITATAQALLEATKECLKIGINQCKPDNHFGNIGFAINQYATNLGYSVVYQFVGHGVGIEFHESPNIYHVARKDSGQLMKRGMIFTIEPMINQGEAKAVIDEADGWTARTIDKKLSAQYEHTVLITTDGHEILTI